MTPEDKKYLKIALQNELDKRASAKSNSVESILGRSSWLPPKLTAASVGLVEGLQDVYEGASQLFGDEDSTFWRRPSEVASRKAVTQELKADPEYGTAANVGYGVGLLAEPVSLAVPMLKGKNAIQAAKIAGAHGAGFGFLGRADDTEDRLRNTLIGGTAGTVLGPAFYGAEKWFRNRNKFSPDIQDLSNDPALQRNLYRMSDSELASQPSKMSPNQMNQMNIDNVTSSVGRFGEVPPGAYGGGPGAADDVFQGRVIGGSRPDEISSEALKPFELQEPGITSRLSKQEQVDAMWKSREPEMPPEAQLSKDALDASDPRYLEKLAERDDARELLTSLQQKSPNPAMREQLEGFKAKVDFESVIKREYEGMTVKALKAEAKRYGVKPASTKAGLVQQLIGARTIDASSSGGIKLYANPLDPRLIKDTAKYVNDIFYNRAGKYVWEAARQNPGSAFGGAVGAGNGFALTDENAGILEKTLTVAGMTVAGAGLIKGSSMVLDKVAPETLNRIQKAFISNYGLPEEFVLMKKGMSAHRNHIVGEFRDVAQEIAKLPVEQRKSLYFMLTGEGGDVSKLVPLKESSRELLKRYGQALVDAGMLDEKTFLKNINTYIHRTMADKSAPKIFGRSSAKLDASEFRPRGLGMTVSKTEADRLLASNEGWRVEKNLKSGQVRIRRDWTKAERIKMKEVEDAAYALNETGKLIGNDLPVYKFFDDVNAKYSVDPEVAMLDPDKYAQMPAGKLPGTQLERYGNLSGKWVPKEIHDDLVQFARIRERHDNPLYQIYAGVVKGWKLSKTALNPVVHTNNVMSNFMLYDHADAGWKHLLGKKGAFARILGHRVHKNDEMVKLANEYGVFSSDYVTKELGALDAAERKFFEQISGDPKDLPDAIAKVSKGIWNATGGKMIDAYHTEDNVFRLGVFMDRLEKGMSPQEAAAEARKWMIDYDINASGINALRMTAMPFLAYTYRVMPLLLESAAKRPTKFMKYIALASAINAYGSKGSEEKAKRERSLMDERYKGTLFGIPNVLRVGEDKAGTGQYLDITRWVPGGDVMDTKNYQMSGGVPGVPAPFQPSFGGPIGIATSLYGNRDPFTGKNIYSSSGSYGEQMGDMGKYLAMQFMPNFPGLPGTYATDKILTAARGGETPLGDKLTTKQAILSTLGVKIRPMDIEKLEMRAVVNAKKQMDEKARELFGLDADRRKKLITEEQFEAERGRVEKDLEKIREKLMEKVGY